MSIDPPFSCVTLGTIEQLMKLQCFDYGSSVSSSGYGASGQIWLSGAGTRGGAAPGAGCGLGEGHGLPPACSSRCRALASLLVPMSHAVVGLAPPARSTRSARWGRSSGQPESWWRVLLALVGLRPSAPHPRHLPPPVNRLAGRADMGLPSSALDLLLCGW